MTRALEAGDDFVKACNYSFLLLKYRMRSRLELRARLEKKKFNPGIVKKVLSFLEDEGYINDEMFARSFIEACLAKGWGRRRIDCRLKQLGVSGRLRRYCLERGSGYTKALDALIARKISYYRDKGKVYQRLLRFLLGRGFDYNEIFNALEKAGVSGFENR